MHGCNKKQKVPTKNNPKSKAYSDLFNTSKFTSCLLLSSFIIWMTPVPTHKVGIKEKYKHFDSEWVSKLLTCKVHVIFLPAHSKKKLTQRNLLFEAKYNTFKLTAQLFVISYLGTLPNMKANG